MKAALIAGSVAAALIFSAGSGWASPFKSADEYYKVRDAAQHLVVQFDLKEVQADPKKFEGRLLEIWGQISGITGSAQNTHLSLPRGEGEQYFSVALPPGKTLEDWPFLDLGASVRLLCRVVSAGEGAGGVLELVIPVKEYEANHVEVGRAKREEEARQAAARRQQALQAQKSSRGINGRSVGRATRGTPVASNDAQLVEIYANAVRYFNRRIDPNSARRIAWSIIRYSRLYGLDARLVMAVIAVESNFNSNAVSPVGAMGLGQLMPGTAGDLGVGNAYNVEQNLEGSTRLLRTHLQNMHADGRPTDEALKLALACYNAGAGAVKKYKGVPPYRETQGYIRKITRLYRQLKGEAP